MTRIFAATIIAFFAVAVPSLMTSARAENSVCWGDNTRVDISCTRITEKLLLSFRGQTKDFIRKSMNAPGRDIENGLHFLSNYGQGEKTGSRDVNVSFEDGRATIVSASVDSPGHTGEFEFVWNVYAVPSLGDEFDRSTKSFRRKPFCSDFSSSSERCQGADSMDHQLTLFQMQNGSAKADLRNVLEASCNLGNGSITVSDPAGDCARLRGRLR